ncbi:MAG: hypothetical protein DHS20C15_04390 [Planctomycetota bacterium]|nr:MAG: hypothetical protein DHS20C15_04390 [Planctomycetota bacterium]
MLAQIGPTQPEELLTGLVERLPSMEGLSCALADLDGDGHLDAVTVEPTTLTVLFGRDDGSFGTRHTVPLNVTTPQHWPDSGPRDTPPIVADVNHDGELDVLVLQRAPAAQGRVLFLEGRGGGRLTAGVDALELEGLRAADVGDFDGDGRLDLVLARTIGGFPSFALPPLGAPAFFIALGNGDGSFKIPSQLPQLGSPSGPAPTGSMDHVFAADLDADGHLDVVTHGVGRVISYRGLGDGTFSTPETVPASQATFDVALADLEGDGDLDLVASPSFANLAFSCGELMVFRWNAGGFDSEVLLPMCPEGTLIGSTGPVALADFDTDGNLDILCSGWDSQIPRNTLLLGDGAGGFAPPLSLDMPAMRSMAVGDLEADGDLDLISAGGHPNLVVSRNEGGAHFSTEATPLSLGSSTFGSTLLALDADRDGDTDLVSVGGAFGSTSVITLLNDGRGDFPDAAEAVQYKRQFFVPSPTDLAAGDLNGDGVVDVIVSDGTDYGIATLLGGGTDLFTLRSVTAVASDSGPIALGDLDLDGDLDLVVGEGSLDAVTLLEGDGTGLLMRRDTLRRPNKVQDVELADLDDDGALELLTVHGEGVGLGVAQGAAPFQFAEPVFFAAGRDARSLLLVDIDADTQLDALVTNTDSLFASVLLGTQGTDFAASPPLQVSAGLPELLGQSPSLALADLNADGLPDLMSRNTEGVSVRLRLPGGGFEPIRTAFVNHRSIEAPFNLKAGRPAIADFDGDGDLDVAVSRFRGLTDAVILENRLVP